MSAWTDEYFDLMVQKLKERKDREGKTTGSSGNVSTDTLAAGSHGMIEVKHGN